jgi:hypothetical protein
MSAVLKQLSEFKRVAEVSTELMDMVSVETLAQMTGKTIKHIKDFLKENQLHHIGKMGKTYFYSKTEVLSLIKQSA